jgi:hypothetical protein
LLISPRHVLFGIAATVIRIVDSISDNQHGTNFSTFLVKISLPTSWISLFPHLRRRDSLPWDITSHYSFVIIAINAQKFVHKDE